jgi:carboxyl-terminal processing protease
VPFDKLEKPLFKPELKTRSAARVLVDQEFRYITEDLDRVKQRLAENKLSLNEKERRRELDESKARKEARTAERAKLKVPEQKVFAVTLENVNKPELQLATNEKKVDEKKADKTELPAVDAVPKSDSAEDTEDEDEVSGAERAALAIKAETLSVLSDLIELQRGGAKGTTASAAVTTK